MSAPSPAGSLPVAPRAAAEPGGGDLRRRLVALTFVRLVVATGLLVVAVLLGLGASGGDRPTSRALQAVVVSLFVASLGYAVALSRGRNLRALAWVQIALDLAAWTAVVYVTGGPASPLSFFFALSTLTAALVLGAGAARLAAVLSIGVYGLLAIGMTSNLLHPMPDQRGKAPLGPSELAFQLVINVVGTLAVAGLSGNLASRLSRAGGALARLEASSAALAALYEDVVRSIPVAIFTCGVDGTIEGANPGAAQLLAVPQDALVGTPVARWLPFLPPDALERRSEPTVGDEVLPDGRGSRRVAYRAAPLYDRDGRARGSLVVVEDRSGLEDKREAVQRAERLASLGRLAAAMAHEIRNPLGAISGCVELVREGGALGAEDRELLATVLREVARLNSLVTDMLAFARPRPPERAPTDLGVLAREVLTLAEASADATRLELASPAAPVVVAVDPAQVRQVLWNLVRNASQASPAGAVVEVSVRAVAGGAEVCVADRGRGTTPSQRAQLFELFYSEHSRGTGLGLAIVRQIAEAHGGAIEAREREGGGSEFVVRFPA